MSGKMAALLTGVFLITASLAYHNDLFAQYNGGSYDAYSSASYSSSGSSVAAGYGYTGGSGDAYAMASFTGVVGTASPTPTPVPSPSPSPVPSPSPSPSPTPVTIPSPTPTPIVVSDTTPPSGSVSINGGDSSTNSTTVTLNLSASDSVGVTGYYVATSSSTPSASWSGWTSITSTTSYTGSVSFILASGDETKTVYVWYKDAAGNVSSQTNDSITLDTTAPIVTVTSPTSSDTYTATGNTVSLSGSASDSSSGVKEVTWSNDKGGSGTASGTTYWSISSISLTSGDNKITVTAKDFGGNTSTDTITVTYNAGSAPTATTGSATNVTATSAKFTGTANANGLSTTVWFEYGIASGAYSNTSATQTIGSVRGDTAVTADISGLSAKTKYYYRLVAQNSAGATYGSEVSFTTNAPPTVTTGVATNVTMISATLNGTVNANGTSTTAWFEYGKAIGTYDKTTTTQSVNGSGDTGVSVYISGLSSGTGYYYRLVAQNGAGVLYGDEKSFTTITVPTPVPTPQPSPTPVASPTQKPSPTPAASPTPRPSPSPTPANTGTVFGSVVDEEDNSLMGVKVAIASTSYSGSATTDEYGYYRFSDLAAGDYTLTYTKSGYTAQSQDISLDEGESKEMGTVVMEAVQKGKIYGNVVNIKGDPIESVKLKLKNVKTNVTKSTASDADGFFEFADIDAGTYVIFAKKTRYKNTQKAVKLEDGEDKEVEIEMKRTTKRTLEMEEVGE